ncbi:hypothetical protein BS78_K205800 [Paspalum vaginatum]|uniref:Uncharacterized protein n=1 Tax=Paspalum vaginatum TaxID=158149 RepID=A0A9W7XEE9_9POAL|nr:hypothetical protein BS78_K205800 [Paspalum vaginatum]
MTLDDRTNKPQLRATCWASEEEPKRWGDRPVPEPSKRARRPSRDAKYGPARSNESGCRPTTPTRPRSPFFGTPEIFFGSPSPAPLPRRRFLRPGMRARRLVLTTSSVSAHPAAHVREHLAARPQRHRQLLIWRTVARPVGAGGSAPFHLTETEVPAASPLFVLRRKSAAARLSLSFAAGIHLCHLDPRSICRDLRLFQ